MVGESCSYEWLSEKLLANDDGVLLLDCRSEAEYQTSHVQGSIHVLVSSILMRRLKAGSVAVQSVVGSNERQRFTDRWKSDTVVLYDDFPPIGAAADGAEGPTSDRNDVVSLLMDRLRTDGCRVSYLQGGFAGFNKKYGHLCVGERQQVIQLESEDHGLSLGISNFGLSEITQEESNRKERHTPCSAFPFPVQVIPYLFLGNAENSADLPCLNRHDIRYILNVTPDIPNTFEDDRSFKYLQIPITDNLSQNLTAFFPSAIAFIDEARSKKCGVLVHCLAGISRSVTVTMAYLMVSKSLSLEDAYDHLRQCKPNISPNFNFMGQLLDFEIILRQRLSCTCSSTMDPSAVRETADTCTACQNTKTYFSSPSLGDHPCPATSPSLRSSSPAEDQTTCSFTTTTTTTLNSTSSPASSSTVSLSSLASDATDSA